MKWRSAQPRGPAFARGALVVAALLYLVVVLRTAWLAEDAYIALRSVDNFVHGYGLTWNTDERVQTFTCPLWVLLLSAVYYFTREPFYTTLAVSLACTLATTGTIVAYGLRRGGAAALAMLVLVCSKAFTDYSTSGLENPLTHLLLASFLVVYLDDARLGFRRLGVLALLASLAAVNRLDTILFVAPPLAVSWWQRRGWRAGAVIGLGLSPLAAWLGFALFYYGFAFPNTAYAKLHTGIPAADLAAQGLCYYVNSLACDYVTLPSIALGLALAVWKCLRPSRLGAFPQRIAVSLELLPDTASLKRGAAVLGVTLYMMYVVRIGGDFMSGRFFAAPLLASCVLLADAARGWRPAALASWSAAILVAGALPATSNLRSGPDYGLASDVAMAIDAHGVADERSFYFPSLGLLRARDEPSSPVRDWVQWGEKDRAEADQAPLVICATIGLRGFYGGPRVHYLDPLGLGDPLIARLPTGDRCHWRIGHFDRHVPRGYEETLRSGENRLEDPHLAVFYDRLRLITRSGLFDRRRLREVWRMLRGRYEGLLAAQASTSSTSTVR